MASFFIDLSSPRQTVVDQPSMLVLLRAQIDSLVRLGPLSQTTFRLSKPTLWTGPQTSTAQSIFDTAPARSAQLTAQEEIDTLPIREQAIILTLLDELNRLRTQPTTTFVAITPAMAIAAVRTKTGQL
jgi:hypothetical protein